ncbi:hybrid sensor histidine kinase/response regulator [Bdellovibrio bacteriovorus]|uniref:histidine kinase n=1 Tax=Bdellovibrio bacteriovorus TaxID=959 RepID=A0A150WMT0_BDEBC|nr:GAF domain-containing hybrid sensor histidine kinase/response regulator [Bdellovibrio bacteriovorus]KYG65772.1 hybrid sensor histidine kinase/response regulator [Bdellovibrio bacteriovorus]
MNFVGGTKTLVKVIQDLSAARTLDDVTSLVRKAAREIAEADGATFVLRDGDMCSYVDEDAIAPLWKGQKFPMSACVSGWAMLNKAQAVIPDIYKDARVPIDAYRPTFVKSMAMTPIRKEAPIGAIGTYWKTVRAPSEEQKELLQALADSVSVAMENLNLYESLNSKIVELRKSNQAKDEFLMNVSHELRTPLNSILGWSDILVQDQLEGEELRLGLDTIQRNARNQLKIVEDLLDSSRILVGRVHLEKIPIDLCQIVNQSIMALKSEIQKKQLKFEVRSSLNTAVIKADLVRVRQIIDNVIMNAIKFSFNGGSVWVHIDKKGPDVELAIKDEGSGIESDFLPHVFERLQQGDNSSTRKYGGLGLGLSIAKHLTEAFDGEIKAESAGPGLGATFRLQFPLYDFDLKAVAPAADVLDKKALQGIKVLVVDDDNDSRHIVERVLKNYGAEVAGVESVSEALKAKDDYEVIVCDLSMPEEDGFSLAHKIREGRTQFGMKIPLVALTAFTDKANEKKALEEGFDRFMGKPFNVKNLISNVVQLRESLH